MLAFLNKRNRKGFTLTELLVSTVIAVIAFYALINSYMGVKQSYTDYKDKTTAESSESLVKNFYMILLKMSVLPVILVA